MRATTASMQMNEGEEQQEEPEAHGHGTKDELRTELRSSDLNPNDQLHLRLPPRGG